MVNLDSDILNRFKSHKENATQSTSQLEFVQQIHLSEETKLNKKKLFEFCKKNDMSLS